MVALGSRSSVGWLGTLIMEDAALMASRSLPMPSAAVDVAALAAIAGLRSPLAGVKSCCDRRCTAPTASARPPMTCVATCARRGSGSQIAC